MIVIIDYGLGNLRSVFGAIKRLGFPALISNNKNDIINAKKLILPGVGAFGDGMANLYALGLVEVLHDIVLNKKTPILGICLGSQLMAKESFEFGKHAGLGWIDASVLKLNPGGGLKIPHVGWNGFTLLKEDSLFSKIPSEALFYYVHSFYISCNNSDITIAECDYGIKFTAVFHQDNIYGTQFHPEKSQLFGLQLLNNFLSIN